MKAPLLNPSFRYISAQDSREPGYLARRFKEIAKEQAKAAEVPKNVTTIKKVVR